MPTLMELHTKMCETNNYDNEHQKAFNNAIRSISPLLASQLDERDRLRQSVISKEGIKPFSKRSKDSQTILDRSSKIVDETLFNQVYRDNIYKQF